MLTLDTSSARCLVDRSVPSNCRNVMEKCRRVFAMMLRNLRDWENTSER